MTLPPDSNPPSHDVKNSTQSRPPIDPSGVISPPLPPPGPGWAYPPPPAPKRFAALGRLVTGLVGSVLLASIILNVYLGIWFSSLMAGPSESTYAMGDKSQRIVILPVNGMIDKSSAGFVHECLAALRKDLPKALVLRIDSGGGGVSASDRMWHEFVQFQKETQIPVVASFGAMAASGGYYIAASADFIMAEPTSITGSIGVIAQAFTVDKLLEKIGVQPELITATEAVKKDMLNPMRQWTDQDRQALRWILDQAYSRFVEVVAEGRDGLSLDAVKKLATGEVFTAREAEERLLIDGLGYIDAAIDKAKQLAGIDPKTKPMVTLLSPPRSLGLLGALSGSAVPRSETLKVGQVRRWIGELGTPCIEYRWIR